MSNMVVQTNVLALNAHRNLATIGVAQGKASQRLSSGFRINSAADDAAGLAISEKMRAQIRGLDQASKNTQDSISLIQTAEGGMQEIDNMLQRIRELTVQTSNDTQENNKVGTGDRQKIQDEINQLTTEIDSMAGRVEFNKKKVIDGSFTDPDAAIRGATDSLSNAKASKSEADAKVAALTTLKTSASNALKSAKDLLAKTSAGSTTGLYNSAVKTVSKAETVYQAAKDKYTTARDNLMSILADAGITDVGSVTSAMFIAGTTENDKLGAKSVAVKEALKSYATAAMAYGLDELNLQGNTNKLSAAMTMKTTAIATYANSDASKADISTGERYKWNTAQKKFATAKATYQSALDKRDLLQKKVDNIDNDLEAATKAATIANTAMIATTNKFDAANELKQKGNSRELYFQVGANAMQGMEMSIGSVKTDTLGIGNGKGLSKIDVVRDTGKSVTSYLDTLDTALSYVSTERSKLGAAQNRLEYTGKSLDVSSENLSSAESRIRDTDMAKEMMQFTKSNVLQQAATSMLAQANQAPQSILKLLG